MTPKSTTRLIPFIFIFLGSYVASYLFFIFLPLITPVGFFSLLIIIVAFPSFYFFQRWAGWKNTLIIILALAGLILLIEGIGVATGFLYGHFFYSDLTGLKILGLVPWYVPFAFIPLLFGTVTLSTQFLQKPWQIIIFSAFLLVAIDLIIDPILVHLGIWVWVTPGSYYGIPLSNFLGWFLTGLITSSVLLLLMKKLIGNPSRIPIFVTVSLVLTLAFWSGFALWSILLIPFIISLFLVGFLLACFLKCWPNK